MHLSSYSNTKFCFNIASKLPFSILMAKKNWNACLLDVQDPLVFLSFPKKKFARGRRHNVFQTTNTTTNAQWVIKEKTSLHIKSFLEKQPYTPLIHYILVAPEALERHQHPTSVKMTKRKCLFTRYDFCRMRQAHDRPTTWLTIVAAF